MFQHTLRIAISTLLISVVLTVGCSAQQTEEQALQSLRAMTSTGKLPAESFAADLESRFANKKTGALAKLLRARIRFETGDFAGAAAILNSDVFQKRSKLADYALWLRGKALQSAGNHNEALNVLSQLLREHGDSVRVRDAKLLWATSAIAAGRSIEVPPFLIELAENSDGEAYLITGKAYEAQGSKEEAAANYLWAYTMAPNSTGGQDAKTRIAALGYQLIVGEPFTLQGVSITAESKAALKIADHLLKIKDYPRAASAYNKYVQTFPETVTQAIQLRRLTALANAGDMVNAQAAFNWFRASDTERQEGYRQLVLGYAKAKMWPQTRATADAMRATFPNGSLVAKTFIDAGLAAREGKNRTDEGYFFNTAVIAFPNAIEVATAQFEAAWFQHESGNYTLSSQMMIDHLARYADKDTSNRGKAGYWAARDSERAGKMAEACAIYDGVIYRYAANWYGHLAMGRMSTLKSNGQCRSTAAPNQTVERAVANLKTVTVAAETAREKELARAEKSDELSTIGLFDWAIDELNEAKKTANNSPKINLALARHYRWKGDNTSALIAMQKSYPDYAQMFPEEMGQEEWSFFYPLANWNEIKYWAAQRRLDPYQVAGLIRQESVFTPSARSGANAHGLMQLLVPTAQSMARKYVSKTAMITATALYQPPLNIELGTAYMRDQLDKFGRFEYVGIAYNAGPGRVAPWRATLPAEMDEFVEAIPFKETKAYVQGIIRNSAQYRRLYDDNGNFKPNVGTRPLRGELDSKSREQFRSENPEISVEENVAE
jgi:soluble lytic murein transglycosylase